MKSVVITLCFLIMAGLISAQSSTKKGFYISNPSCDLQCAFDRFYATQSSKKLDTFCIQSVSFVSFSISKDGRPTNIKFISSQPAFVVQLLSDFFASTGSNWKSDDKTIQQLVTNGKRFLMPFVYNLFQAGCKFANGSFANLTNMLDFSPDLSSKPKFLGSGNEPWFDGILLKPIILISPYN